MNGIKEKMPPLLSPYLNVVVVPKPIYTHHHTI